MGTITSITSKTLEVFSLGWLVSQTAFPFLNHKGTINVPIFEVLSQSTSPPYKKMLFHNLQKFKKYFVSINVKKYIVSFKTGSI